MSICSRSMPGSAACVPPRSVVAESLRPCEPGCARGPEPRPMVHSWRVLAALPVLAMWLSWPLASVAHGLLMDAETDGLTITGTLYYSNGDLAVRELVELQDLTDTNAPPASSQTDDAGRFTFAVVPSRHYRLSAYGDEGHSVVLELEAVANARPQLQDESSDTQATQFLPAWAVVGGLLLLSLVPMLLSRFWHVVRRAA